MTDHTYKLVTHILHTMVFRDGELIAILPPGYAPGWVRMAALVIDDEKAPF